MATQARHQIRRLMAGLDVMHRPGMAITTDSFRHCATASLHLNRLVEIAGGKGIRMPESMVDLGPILPHKVVWRMAVVAGGDRVVARLHPTIQMVLHDVAVRARVGIVRQVRPTARVDEGVAADTERQPQQDTQGDSGQSNSIETSHDTRTLMSWPTLAASVRSSVENSVTDFGNVWSI